MAGVGVGVDVGVGVGVDLGVGVGVAIGAGVGVCVGVNVGVDVGVDDGVGVGVLASNVPRFQVFHHHTGRGGTRRKENQPVEVSTFNEA